MEKLIKCDVFDIKKNYELIATLECDVNEDEPEYLVAYWSGLFYNKVIEVIFYYPNGQSYTLGAYNGEILYSIDEREILMSTEDYFRIRESYINKLELCGLI